MKIKRKLQKAVQAGAIRALTTVERVQTGVAFNPFERGFSEHPYPQYRRLREKDPVHRSRLTGGYVLSRYDDIASVLRDPRFLVDDRKRPDWSKRREQLVKEGIVLPEDPPEDSASMLRMDPPDHTRLRSLVSKAFTPRAVEALRPRIEQLVDEMLDSVDGSTFDVVQTIAYPLPVTVIAEMLGVPTEDRAQFKRWSDDLVKTIGMSDMEDMRVSAQAGRELRAYFAKIVEERRREPREDLLSALIAVEEEGERLSLEELFSTCTLLLVAGNETTTNLIGNGLLALLRNPEQAELLRRDPSLIGNAVEELLRYDSPVQATSRFAQEAVEIDGHALPPNTELILLLGSANHDPKQFADPDRLDITRSEVRHLSFSHGIHYCLGAPLARVEGAAALSALVQRFPNMRLTARGPSWSDNIILRGPHRLEVSAGR